MKVLYSYIAYSKEGSRIHVDGFIKSFRELGEVIIDAGIVCAPFMEDKSTWSFSRKLKAKREWITFNLKHTWRIFWLARRLKPDVILFRFLQNHQFFVPIVVLSFLYPVVLELNSIRTIEDPDGAGWLSNLLDRLTLKRAKRCFVVSQRMKDHILGRDLLDEDKLAVIANGVDVVMFDSTISSSQAKISLGLENRFVVGFVGSFKHWHGIENILLLAEAMKPEQLDITFLIVGDGMERSRYEATAEAKGLKKNFIFTGVVPHEHVREYLAAMDVAIAPHRSDSFQHSGGFHGSPLKIFEYMAMGKAIIAAPIGQIKDIIADGESGRLVYSEDIASLKEALLQLYNDQNYRESLGRNARARVERCYSWKVNAEKVRQLCREAITSST